MTKDEREILEERMYDLNREIDYLEEEMRDAYCDLNDAEDDDEADEISNLIDAIQSEIDYYYDLLTDIEDRIKLAEAE